MCVGVVRCVCVPCASVLFVLLPNCLIPNLSLSLLHSFCSNKVVIIVAAMAMRRKRGDITARSTWLATSRSLHCPTATGRQPFKTPSGKAIHNIFDLSVLEKVCKLQLLTHVHQELGVVDELVSVMGMDRATVGSPVLLETCSLRVPVSN